MPLDGWIITVSTARKGLDRVPDLPSILFTVPTITARPSKANTSVNVHCRKPERSEDPKVRCFLLKSGLNRFAKFCFRSGQTKYPTGLV